MMMKTLSMLVLAATVATGNQESTITHSSPDILLGERAEWLRGSWGINWKPTKLCNGRSETLIIDDFLHQIRDLKTLDYLQLHLGDSYIYSSIHLGPHELLESLWEANTNSSGRAINLVVPRAVAGVDPFLNMLTATKAAGLRTMVYVNSSQMLERDADTPNPDVIPDITARWKAWCDTNPAAQAFIKSQSYHVDEKYKNRAYLFCYAEFVLKEYAIRYGDLIDAWLFDSGRFMEQNGDSATNDQLESQRIYQAFADAVHAGNPNAAVSFNNGPGSGDYAKGENPFSPATRYDDYMFGHPFQGGKLIGDHTINPKLGNSRYDRNYSTIQWIVTTSGYIHANDPNNLSWKWDDKVVGHFDPPMSTSAWNGGRTPTLSNEEFKRWNWEALTAGGAISWGAPLINDEGAGAQLLIQNWGMTQLTLLDEYLIKTQSPGTPNWARATTPLPISALGKVYSHTLVEGVDFWDPEGDAVTLSMKGAPNWLTLKNDLRSPGSWTLSGTPTETTAMEYAFRLRAEDASGATEKSVALKVGTPANVCPHKGSVHMEAAPNTTFGVDEVVTMTSGVQTAPDNQATFQIAFDVKPMKGAYIASKRDSSSTTSNHWGIGADAILKGSDGDYVKSIENLRIINFNANGSNLSVDAFSNLSFEYITVLNGQSTHDRIITVVNGVQNGSIKMKTNPQDLYLRTLGYVPITHVTLGVGSSKRDAANKWSVQRITVSYDLLFECP